LNIFWKVIKKVDKSMIPLARRHEPVHFDKDLSYSQQLQYVTVTNRKNLWKEAYKKYGNVFFIFYDVNVANIIKKSGLMSYKIYNYYQFYFSDGFFCREKLASSNLSLSPHDTIIRDILTRFYNCPIINLQELHNKTSSTAENESHGNILPANLVFETNNYFYLLQVGCF